MSYLIVESSCREEYACVTLRFSIWGMWLGMIATAGRSTAGLLKESSKLYNVSFVGLTQSSVCHLRCYVVL